MAAFVYLTPDKTNRDSEPRIAMQCDISARSVACGAREKERCFLDLRKNYSVNKKTELTVSVNVFGIVHPGRFWACGSSELILPAEC